MMEDVSRDGEFAVPSRKHTVSSSTAATATVTAAADVVSDSNSMHDDNDTIDVIQPPLPSLQYTPPPWSSTPKHKYELEIIKGGVTLSRMDISLKPFYVFGRLPQCDISLEHPSISRYHSILQHRSDDDGGGVYVCDLGSTHGSTMNKVTLKPRAFFRLHPGAMLRLGCSSRTFVIHGGPLLCDDDVRRVQKNGNNDAGDADADADSVSWGFDVDAREDDDVSDNGAMEMAMARERVAADGAEVCEGASVKAPYYHKDPKRSLRASFEMHGIMLNYEVEETGPGHARVYKVAVKLPIDGEDGEPLFAHAEGSRRRETERICALEACRIMDSKGILRPGGGGADGSVALAALAQQSIKKRRAGDESDDDTFFDRTGDVERKRLKRKQRRVDNNAPSRGPALTYESLSAQLIEVRRKLESVNERIVAANATLRAAKEAETSVAGAGGNNDDGDGVGMDDFDMGVLDGARATKEAKFALQRELGELEKEERRVSKLCDIARPAGTTAAKETECRLMNEQEKRSTTTVTSTAQRDNIISKRQRREERKAALLNFTMDDSDNENIGSDVEENTLVPTSPQTFGLIQSTSSPHDVTNRPTLNDDGDTELTSVAADTSLPSPSLPSPPPSPKPPKLKLTLSDYVKAVVKPSSSTNNGTASASNKSNIHEEEAAWMPPVDQTGDGRTSLNDKYGY